jgi:hypothetical protein
MISTGGHGYAPGVLRSFLIFAGPFRSMIPHKSMQGKSAGLDSVIGGQSKEDFFGNDLFLVW